MKKLILLILLLPAQLFAQEQPVDEDALFSGDDTVVENKVQDNTAKDEMDARSMGISGSITGAYSYSKIDDSAMSGMTGVGSFRPYMVGDLYFDARMPGGYKGFASFELEHDASVDETTGQDQTTFSTNELFVDFNFSRYVYFRTGKQVLQWGQCYLWNPTDMINIENKSFIDRLEDREGTYGIKMHIPFGTGINIYGFAGMNRIDNAKDVSGAGKFEFLLSGTEMAFSVWGRRKYNVVYGYDFSSRVFTVDIKGEASYSHGSNFKKTANEDGTLTAQRDEDANVFRAALNISRAFDFGEKADRITVSIEGFYNGEGYEKNPFDDEGTYIYDKPVEFTADGTDYSVPGGDMTTYMAGHGLYNPNYLSRYYAAVFVTFSEFIISDMTLTVNGITNIQHGSYIVSSGISYANINNFTAGLAANCYLGDRESEYRVWGKNFDVQVTTGIIF